MAYRRVVAAYFVLQGLCAGTWTAQIPAMQVRLALDHAALGTVLLALSCGVLAAMPVAGALLARARGPAPLALGALAHAVTLAVLGSVRGVGASMACLFCFGAANTVVQVAVNQHALAVQRRAGHSVMAGFHGCWSVAAAAAALAAYAGGRLEVAPGAHLQAVAAAAAVAVAGLVVCGGAQPLPAEWRPRAGAAGEASFGVVPRRPRPLARTRGSGARGLHGSTGDRRRPSLVVATALGATAAGAMAVEAVAFDWGAVLYRQALGGDAARAGLGYAVLMLGMTLGRLLADRAADRVRPANLLAGLAGTVALASLAAASVAHPAAVLPALAAMGLGLSAMVPLLLAACDRIEGLAPARALATVSALGAAGALAGPTALGWSAHLVGLRGAFAGVAAAALVVGLAGRRLLASLPTPPRATAASCAGVAWRPDAAARDLAPAPQ